MMNHETNQNSPLSDEELNAIAGGKKSSTVKALYNVDDFVCFWDRGHYNEAPLVGTVREVAYNGKYFVYKIYVSKPPFLMGRPMIIDEIKEEYIVGLA